MMTHFKKIKVLMKILHIFLSSLLVLLLLVIAPVHLRANVEAIADLSHNNLKVGKYRALIIGINDYEDENISDLSTAVKDAEEMAVILESRYGFHVELLINEEATKKNIYQALRNLVKRATLDDSVLLYYAGHGEIDRTFDDGWWIPVDAKGGDPITYLDNIQVQKAIKSMRARHVLLVSDSCYAGTLFGQFRSLPKVIDDNYYLSLYNERSRWGMTSGNKTPVGDEGTEGHSIFAYQLLKQLKENEKPYVSTQEIYARIAPVISNNSEQTPMYRPMRNSGDQGGEFIFIASSGALLDSPSKLPRKSVLSVTSNVPFAEVYVNGHLVGRTNTSQMAFAPGNYKVAVKLKGYETYEREIHLTEGRHKSLHAFIDKQAVINPALPESSADEVGGAVIVNSLGMNFIPIEPGQFTMGSSKAETGRSVDEAQHQVTLTKEFYLGQHEVTVGQWRAFVNATGYQTAAENETVVEAKQPDYTPIYGYKPSRSDDDAATAPSSSTEEKKQNLRYWDAPGYPQTESSPVTCVTWEDIQVFINWLKEVDGKAYRLPTEAEWEYACRATSQTIRFWGDSSRDACQYANIGDQALHKAHSVVNFHSCDDGFVNPAPVGSFIANTFGLYDMLGNVSEWCYDKYGNYKTVKKITYQGISKRFVLDTVDPKGPNFGFSRVIRGGNWQSNPPGCRSANRGYRKVDFWDNTLGFRLVGDF